MTTISSEDDDYYGIPFVGWIKINDDEDTIRMLREQIGILQAECQRMRKIMMEHGLND
jgi:hypothetical protein